MTICAFESLYLAIRTIAPSLTYPPTHIDLHLSTQQSCRSRGTPPHTPAPTRSPPPSKSSGQYNSTVGTLKEAAGNATGAQGLQQSGQQQHTEGEGEVGAAKAQGYVQGAMDRVGGYVDSVVGAVTGDKTQQTSGEWMWKCRELWLTLRASGNVRNEKGQAQQELNK